MYFLYLYVPGQYTSTHTRLPGILSVRGHSTYRHTVKFYSNRVRTVQVQWPTNTILECLYCTSPLQSDKSKMYGIYLIQNNQKLSLIQQISYILRCQNWAVKICHRTLQGRTCKKGLLLLVSFNLLKGRASNSHVSAQTNAQKFCTRFIEHLTNRGTV